MFITNPVSGSGNQREIEKLIRRKLDFRFDLKIVHSEYAGHTCVFARQAREENYDAVVAVGGDGTAHEAGIELIGSDTALGIIATGSGNGIARSLHLPLDVEESIERINQWQVKKIDTGKINNYAFIGVAGLGFEALISQKFVHLKHRGFINYVRLIASEYLHFAPIEVVVEVKDCAPHKIKVFSLAIANTCQYGNSAFIAPKAVPDDGVLSLTAILPFTHIAAPALATRLFNRTINNSPLVKTYNGDSFKIHSSEKFIHIDGEPVEIAGSLEVSILPLSLTILGVKNSDE